MVTLSRNALTTAVTIAKRIMTLIGLPFASFAVRIAIYSKRPLPRAVLTMIIIPRSKKMVPKSICSRSPSQVTIPMKTTTAAPIMAATARWIRSSMMRA
ncbi:hypothetical protein DSECCO2_517220 [anaerobic digester metagenome]